nr:hypothetical protein [uncultured Rhodoferax sp.]
MFLAPAPYHIALAALCAGLPALGLAQCKRPVQVPMAAAGLSVVVQGESVRGVYPEILESISSREQCQFVVSVVPRARLEKLFEAGKADMLVASTRSDLRDAFGVFIPMMRSRAMALSLGDTPRPPLKTTRDLLDNQNLRLVVVRGFDYGPAYRELISAMEKEQRLTMEADPVAVARFLKANPHAVTVMLSTVLYGAMQEDTRFKDQLDKLRYEPLDNIAWGESGVYLSKTALDPALMQTLQSAMRRTARTGVVHQSFKAYYPPHVLKDSIRPLDTGTP